MLSIRHLILQEINVSLEITSNSKVKSQPCRKSFPSNPRYFDFQQHFQVIQERQSLTFVIIYMIFGLPW